MLTLLDDVGNASRNLLQNNIPEKEHHIKFNIKFNITDKGARRRLLLHNLSFEL